MRIRIDFELEQWFKNRWEDTKDVAFFVRDCWSELDPMDKVGVGLTAVSLTCLAVVGLNIHQFRDPPEEPQMLPIVVAEVIPPPEVLHPQATDSWQEVPFTPFTLTTNTNTSTEKEKEESSNANDAPKAIEALLDKDKDATKAYPRSRRCRRHPNWRGCR
jgi:hypothetical protein